MSQKARVCLIQFDFFQKKIEIEKKVKEESKLNFRKRRSAAIAEVM